mgnify:CR=1 FL=1
MDPAQTPEAGPHVVVVGAGLAGLRTVERLRRLGHAGPVTMVGAEPLAAYDRPPLTKAALAADETPTPPYLRAPEKYAELDVDLRLGVAATALDTGARALTLDDGSTLGYDELVVATGSAARRVAAWDVPGVHVLRTFDDLLRLRIELDGAASVAVVGAGVLGCEVAATARERGLEVHLVDVEDRPLARVAPPQVGAWLAGIHAEQGVRLHLGSGVESLTDGPTLDLADETTLSPDLVVVAVGSVPSTDWLAGSDVDLDPASGGVAVDERGATSAPHVWAVGDIAAAPHPTGDGLLRLEHWTAAGDTAGRTAAFLLGQEPRLPAEVPYVWSDQFGLKLQTLGLPDADDELTVVAGDPAERSFLAVLAREGRVTGAVALAMPAPLARCRTAVADGEPLTDLLARAPWERKKVSA